MARGRAPKARCGTLARTMRFPSRDIDDILPGIIEQCDRVFYNIGMDADFDQRLIGWVSALRERGGGTHTPDEFIALDHLLHDLRLFKSRAELTALRRAARITVAAHRRAMSHCRPGLFEYEVEAEFAHEFRRQGARSAYLPIVGSGPNSCVLHYHANQRQLQDGDLLLVDAGCEFDYYASDVTRTYPVNGRFTPEQRAVYEIVLEAQEAAFAAVIPGNHWNDPHEAARRVIARGLRSAGLLRGNLKTLLHQSAYRPFFMHRTGHWLGMDVHDVGEYKVSDQWRLLEPGMVLTVEPGIYVAPGSRLAPKKWWGIGVRIEDDVLVTKDGYELLTPGSAAHGRRSRGLCRERIEWLRLGAIPALHYDIVIAGGGMVGASLGCALARLPLRAGRGRAVSVRQCATAEFRFAHDGPVTHYPADSLESWHLESGCRRGSAHPPYSRFRAGPFRHRRHRC